MRICPEERIKELVDWNNFKLHSGMSFDHYALAHYLVKVIEQGVPGDVVELGCYQGETSKVLQKIVLELSNKKLYVYDSFEGLPERDHDKGDGFTSGGLVADKETVIENFKRNDLPPPIILKAWFKDINTCPDPIAFAFLDGDFYASIKDSLSLVWEKMSPKGIVAIHDYHSKPLRGVKLATDEFLANYNHTVLFVHKDKDLGNDIFIVEKS